MAAAPPAAFAQPPPPSITLSPSMARGVALGNQRIGPFSIRNDTGRDYDLRAFPVLLGQKRDGGLFVRLDGAARRRARALMDPSDTHFDFPRGATAGASTLVQRLPRQHSLYGGLLFEATPRRPKGAPEQIAAVLRLNARILLDPRQSRRRVSFTSQPIRVEQAGPQRLALQVPVRNRGNAFVQANGSVRVRDATGKVVARAPLNGVEVLPGAVVELSQELTRPLPAGGYTLEAYLRAGPSRFRAAGDMRLVGVNEVAAPAARLDRFQPPQAYQGRTATLEASFRNTGNVPFQPQASFEIHATGDGTGVRLEKIPARVSRADPGSSGTVKAEFATPESSRPFDLTVRLVSNGRVLDERTVSVTPTAPPSALRRAVDFATAHAVALLAILALALVSLALVAGAYIRRLRAAARAPAPTASPEPIAVPSGQSRERQAS